ncbi:uncharacterized protein LOC135477209 isoform X2 [Liolophura sinensis]|uniref:uncharacterized protein LOC135477209 isoform X2 n=1 Tax=Liolophura sinensis TaxID=3198878 RepID=UPI0031596182
MAEGQPGHSEPSLSMKMVLSTVRHRFRNVRQLSTDKLAQWMKEPRGENAGERSSAEKREDTRPVEEYEVSHLPEAVRIDPDVKDISSVSHTWSHRDTDSDNARRITVVCYCSLGYRSSRMVERLQDYLATNSGNVDKPAVEVYNLEGSLFKWANEGRPMVDYNNQPTIYAHPFSAVWGRLLSERLRREKPS